jgi:signal transduction histidine kinase
MQEALANIRRHAQATRLSVDVRVMGDALHLRVSDNGVGLPKTSDADSRPQLGVGIPGMQARVRQLGGELAVAGSRRGTGTTVRATMPLIAPTDGAAPPSSDTLSEANSGFAPMAGQGPSR